MSENEKNVTPVKNYFISTTDDMNLDLNEDYNQNSIPKTYNLSTDDTIKRSSDSFSQEESGHKENLSQNEHKMFQHGLKDGTRTIVHGSISIQSLGLVQENDLMKKDINEINNKISNLETKMEEIIASLNKLNDNVGKLNVNVENLSDVQKKTKATVETLLARFNEFIELYKMKNINPNPTSTISLEGESIQQAI